MRTLTYNTQNESNINLYEDEKDLDMTMTLSPDTLNLRDQFRNRLTNSLNNTETHNLPKIKKINGEEVIDKETIIEINNKTSSEEREEFIQQVLDHVNPEDTKACLLVNSTEPVIGYIHHLIVRNESNEVIMENSLYPIGNILVYTASSVTGLETVRELISSLNESMYIYNNNRMFSTLSNQIVEHNQYIEGINSLTEQSIQQNTVEQGQVRIQNLEDYNLVTKNIGQTTIEKMTQNTLSANKLVEEMGWNNQEKIEKLSEDFQKIVDERIAATRGIVLQRIMLAGGTYVASAALTSIGLPPFGVINGIVRGISAASQHLGVFAPPVQQTPGIIEIIKAIPDFFN